MSHITAAHHTSFTVAKLERSVEFFRDMLGLEVSAPREINQRYFDCIVGLSDTLVRAAFIKLPGGHQVELFEYVQPRGQSYTPRPCDPGSCHLALLVDDLQALHANLAPRGVHFVSPPVLIDAGPNRGAYAAYVRDPNGILLELFQPPREHA